MKLLVTGGAGYIGSHTVIELIRAGHEPVIFDNLSNASRDVVLRLEELTGKHLMLIEGDIRDAAALKGALADCDGVLHFAGLKAVGESVAKPLEYYDNNVNGTLVLLKAMREQNVKTIVFSSSATVYGDPQYLPIDEQHPLSTTNPYGQTKLVIEEMLRDLYASDNAWRIGILRYFNPVGAHESGQIGEQPNGIPNNLMPFVAQTAAGVRDQVSVFGDDYDTPDGTGVRDYIHVIDLAEGHVKALDKLAEQPGCFAVNLGTGEGYSVLNMIEAFAKASGQAVPHQVVERRPGDIASCYADPKFAEEFLNWRATRGIEAMCIDQWRWQSGG